MSRARFRLLLSLLLFLIPASLSADEDLSGQDARAVFLKPGTPTMIPLDRVHGAGGINFSPSLNQPRKVSAEAANRYLKKDFQVIGLVVHGRAVAYPVRILNWHEVVNDTVDGVPVLVTYCPLCQSGLVFDRRVDGAVTDFDVCGLLYRGNMLMYDHKTLSLWTQLRGEAVTGASLGKRLKLIPIVVTTWKEWRSAHPDTEALSLDTGFERDYLRNPMRMDRMKRGMRRRHEGHWDAMVRPDLPELAPDAMVFGVQSEKFSAAVPLKVLRKKKAMTIPLGPETVRLEFKEGPRAFYPATDLFVKDR